MTAALPPYAIEAVAAELRRRLASPTPGTSDKERQRLRTRMEQLRKQNEWGDLPYTDYRRLRSDVVEAEDDGHVEVQIAGDGASGLAKPLRHFRWIVSQEILASEVGFVIGGVWDAMGRRTD